MQLAEFLGRLDLTFVVGMSQPAVLSPIRLCRFSVTLIMAHGIQESPHHDVAPQFPFVRIRVRV
jgi:hypothetical protein